jgi:cobalt-zinc-cadmium efflux system outer membrane protein
MGFRLARSVLWVVAAVLGGYGQALAQRPVSRAQAVEAAVTVGPRLAVAQADTAVALAALITARALPNPTLAASYTKDPPPYHSTLEIPIDFPWLRGPRVGAASAARTAAQYHYAFQRAVAALDADTTYTRALATREHARLSRRNAQDADSLRRMAVRRRDAGDASDLDVELAAVNAGQQANAAASDSLTYESTLLDLQTVIGIVGTQPSVTPSDSLGDPPPNELDGDAAPPTPTLEVAAAQQTLASAQLSTALQRRSIWGTLALIGGFDWGDPTNPGLLPNFGLSLPLPLFSRGRGPIMQAEAELQRARAELTLARAEGAARIARARRERDISVGKINRDRLLLASANRVASMSLTAYREGESALPNVLEAQRNARDILNQYIDDLAQAWIAAASLRVYTLTPARAAQ